MIVSSKDRIAVKARAAGARVVVEACRGYGRAMPVGLSAGDAKPNEIPLFLDGDGSDRPEIIPLVLADP